MTEFVWISKLMHFEQTCSQAPLFQNASIAIVKVGENLAHVSTTKGIYYKVTLNAILCHHHAGQLHLKQ